MLLLAAALSLPAPPAVLREKCESCHGAAKSGGLAVTTTEAILAGGTRGPAIVPGDPASSAIVRFARGQSAPRMPLGGAPLSDAEIAVIEKWIAAMPPQKARSEMTWWAFRRVEAPPPGGPQFQLDPQRD